MCGQLYIGRNFSIDFCPQSLFHAKSDHRQNKYINVKPTRFAQNLNFLSLKYYYCNGFL